MSTKTYDGWQEMPTLQFKEIISELIEAKEERLAKLIISDTGLGKTNTIKIFQRKYSRHTYVIKVGDSFKLADIVDEILQQLGLDTSNVKRWANEARIRSKLHIIEARLRELKMKGEKVIMIFDETENLKPNSLRMMKELYDHVIEYCSIVLIGTQQILDTIFNTRRRNRTGVPQLWRRFKAGKRDITPINKARDFKPFFNQYSIEPNLQDLLMELCENYGELHDYLEPVLRHAAGKGEKITEQLFRLYHKLPKIRRA
jgi:DNA transposition AAA+ family ATPase